MSLGKIVIYHTTDQTDCETCGSSWENGYEITYNGKTYGCTASASCFGSIGNTLADALIEMFNDLGCGDDLDIIPYVSDTRVVEILTGIGFTVECHGEY